MVNYIGPNAGDGIRVFYDGTLVTSDDTADAKSFQSGSGRIIAGRDRDDLDDLYASVNVDELTMFNQSLTTEQINILAN